MTKARDLSVVPNQSLAFKNRIINGAMQIDQRNAGASVTPNSSYTLDRWAVYNTQTSKLTVQQNAGSVTPPAGFSNYLGVTSSSAYSVTSSDFFALRQGIEGVNTADLNIGTANAKTVTLSFWVRSSLTGTFGGALQNSANDRNYLFSYSISSANTWEQKSVTITLDQTGTWIGATNGAGLFVAFGLGAGSTYSGTANTWQAGQLFQPNSTVSVVGTNGATFYITGVQLEVGSTATSFDYRPYGTELALCQRYYVGASRNWFTVGYDPNYSTINSGGLAWSYRMRTTPSIIIGGGGMSGHHGIAPTVRNGPDYSGVDLQFSGSALRTNVNCAAVVDLALSAEL